MWDLERTHKIGELVASIAVVVSLIFVGVEVQQNNQIQRQTATRSLVRDFSDAYRAFADPEIACLFIRLVNDRENLTGQEAVQIETILHGQYKVLEELHYQYEQGMIDDSVWIGFRQQITFEAGYEGYRVWWLGYQYIFSPRFREFMDGVLSSTPLNPDPYFINMKCDAPVGSDYW